MSNQEKDIETMEGTIIEDKPVWQIPELTVISVSNTKSGSPAPSMEGSFYGPSF